MPIAPAAQISEDQDIAELLRAGARQRAFDLLLQRYEGKVFRLCCALLREPAQAEDAAQESLVRIWRALDSYDGRAALSTWIYAITRNRCLSALERRRPSESLSEPQIAAEAEAALAQVPMEGEDEIGEPLRALVDALPERSRRVLTLYYFEERSIEEVARMLGCPEGTVKTHLYRARAALSEQLRQHGLDHPSHWLESEHA